MDPDLLHESVDGEWSFIETSRHLAFATDAWVRRVILGDPAPWDPLDLPWDEMLASDTEPVVAPRWPPPRSFPVRQCLRIVLNEEWEPRRFAERDLAVLEAQGT